MIALGVFVHNGRILAIRYPSAAAAGVIYRPPGGAVEYGERGIDAVRREIREELHSEIDDLRYLDTVENIFPENGRGQRQPHGHEIILLFSGTLARRELYRQATIPIVEDTGEAFTACWIDIDATQAPDGPLLVPRQLPNYLPT